MIATSASADPRARLLELVGIRKRYGGTVALHDCDLSVNEGTVHGLLGKNGAGKSSLVGAVAGSVRPDGGVILLDGVDITGLSLVGRRELGIRLLDQHPELAPSLTVAENLLLPDWVQRRGLISWRAMFRQAESVLDEYELALLPKAVCGELAPPDQRRLSIVKALSGGGRLVLLDEPTASLTRTERRAFFDWIRRLNAGGRTFLFISHFTNEIRELCTDYTILRNGSVVDSGSTPSQLAASELSRRVIGSDVHEFRRAPRPTSEPLLELTNFAPPGVQPFDLSVGRGEIVGLVGLPGSGATTTARTLAGLTTPDGGSIRLEGRAVSLKDVASTVDQGIAYLTSDRLGEGIIPELSVAETTVLGRWPVKALRTIDRGAIFRTYNSVRDLLSISTANPSQPISELSGGNQQKVLIGRLLAARPKVLVLDEPTHGIDVGVKEEVHRLINTYTEEGNAVIVLAYDSDEMVRLVDRAVIFRDGAVVAQLVGEQLTVDGIVGAVDGTGHADEDGQP